VIHVLSLSLALPARGYNVSLMTMAKKYRCRPTQHISISKRRRRRRRIRR
jgi:hypothetical protein